MIIRSSLSGKNSWLFSSRFVRLIGMKGYQVFTLFVICTLILVVGRSEAQPIRDLGIICESNSIFMERCNICLCSKDGFSKQCTTFHCNRVEDSYQIGPPSWSDDKD